MKVAIKIDDLNALISKHKRGDSVLWEGLVNEAEAMLYAFNGVGQINCLDDIIETGRKRINKENRYPHTLEDLAALFGVNRKALYSWGIAGLIAIKRKRPPKRLKMRCSWVYDARDILKQLELNAKKGPKR